MGNRIFAPDYRFSISLVVLLAVLLSSSVSSAQLNVEFEPITDGEVINSPNPVQALDIAYDSIEPDRQAFHLFLPDTEGSFPLVIYFHGGGFISGSRDAIFANPSLQRSRKYFLENGIAFASAGYRLIANGQPDDEGVIKCLGDSKRALQFIRHHSTELNVDPSNVALMGGSAGAGTSLWLGTRDDMADPVAKDLVLRESTRVNAVSLGGCQATYDLTKWESVVFSKFSFTIEDAVDLLGFERLSNFYGGVDALDDLYNEPELIQYRQDVDMLFHMSNDDPPMYVLSRSPAIFPEEDLFHHGSHGIAIQNHALSAGVPEVKARINFTDIDTTDGECADAFLARHLGVATGILGDVNNDGSVNLLDVGPFVDVLTDSSPFNFNADINCDGRVNLLDVSLFIDLLSG